MLDDDSVLRVLLVDDNPAIHEDFRKILTPCAEADPALAELEASLFDTPATSKQAEPAARFELCSAHQGEEAIAMVCDAVRRNEPYALAFVDVRMPPGIDGIQTVARLWEIDPSLQAVVCTAYSDHSWEGMSRVLGRGDRFLVLKKPFDPIEVLQLAQALTTKWVLAREVSQRIGNLEAHVTKRERALELANRELQTEIEARRRAEDDLRKLATHDALTGLPNRLMLQDRLAGALARRQRKSSQMAVLLLDLDGFKEVNDTLGHAAGDELLRQTARRLQSTIRSSDTVARMGGDEFVILLEELAQPEDAALVAERAVEACSAPIVVGGRPVQVTPSIGIALSPDDGSGAETLLECADLAMYQAKSAGGAGYSYFDQELLESSMERLTMRSDLARALENGELEVWYQPLAELGSCRVRGMEALLRWRRPGHGVVSPMSFITEAERSGLILPIGRWVLETACAQLAEWQAAGAGGLTMAVNLSKQQIRDPDVVETVRRALRAAGLSPRCLEIELTESTVLDDFELSKGVLAELADLGVRIVIDDFGSGYASLNRLKSLPIDGIKIDRFFIKSIADDPWDAAVVTAIVSMAHAVGIDVVAEGIETAEQLAGLRSLEWGEGPHPVCDAAQGFLLGEPAPADRARTVLFGDAPVESSARRASL